MRASENDKRSWGVSAGTSVPIRIQVKTIAEGTWAMPTEAQLT